MAQKVSAPPLPPTVGALRGVERGYNSIFGPREDAPAEDRSAYFEPVTYLDTRSITGPPAETVAISGPYNKPPDRLEWEVAVAEVNRDHDYARSLLLMDRGAMHFQEQVRQMEWRTREGSQGTRPLHGLASPDDVSFSVPLTRKKQVEIALWHYERAMARRRRRQRLELCGSGEYVITSICALGHEHHHDMGCGDYRLCIACRGRQVANYRRDVRLYAEELRARAEELHLGTALQDRLLTLTAPDYGTTEERLRIRVKAWRLFSRRLARRWTNEAERLAAIRRLKTPADVREAMGFLRVLEVTPGKDEQGHFHHHVWMHGPWLAQDDAHDMWRESVLHVVSRRFPHLLSEYDTEHRWQVDIRAADPATFDQELIKYLLKDWSEDKQGRRIAPAAFGRMLRALEGVRMRQGAAGWKAIADERREVPLCRDCGTIAVAELRKVDRWPKGSAEPPGGCAPLRLGYRIRPPPLAELPKWGDQQNFHRF